MEIHNPELRFTASLRLKFNQNPSTSHDITPVLNRIVVECIQVEDLQTTHSFWGVMQKDGTNPKNQHLLSIEEFEALFT